MLYALYTLLEGTEWARWFNFLRYPTFRIVAAGVVALALGMWLGPSLIQRLRFAQHGQDNVREDTPQTHQKKKGTPTMGGALMLLCFFLATLLFANLTSRPVWAMLWLTGSFGAIGFLDDYLKLSKRNSKGLPGRYKLLLQTLFYLVAIGSILCTWESGVPQLVIDTKLVVPFIPTRHFNPDLGWFYLLFGWLILVGTSNAVNLTDGLDGLAIAPTVVSALVFAVLCYLGGSAVAIADGQSLAGTPIHQYLGIAPIMDGAELAVVCASMVGAGVSFLWFNSYPASIFMGDVGSLALGGALGGLAILSKNELVSAIIHGVFLVEALSVVLQVASFKTTGRRIFRMAPVHHHFELKGWAEPKIIVRFWIMSVMCGGVALLALKLR
ncbi:MAG: phospho-N-acetylmuramoyl-pentapeptide-transferase [Proteobacteria bacterium]|nr:phospho-N-acetylmuramoyl-pentapeptide-transferase [Cystobacterineae bacterium]MCL2258736.1 phospho-N-acetylmuramoyl-pentapeptide-transferase [Cystobacterineae bacterium]MCL2314284.1 phospho-N-acetylmuramoyl-pentapeptide-transferase [Pseudomonadota bacterium]